MLMWVKVRFVSVPVFFGSLSKSMLCRLRACVRETAAAALCRSLPGLSTGSMEVALVPAVQAASLECKLLGGGGVPKRALSWLVAGQLVKAPSLRHNFSVSHL